MYMYIYTYMHTYIHTFQPLFMYHYSYYENSSIFSHYSFTDVFVINWTITYSRKRHSVKTSAELFWVILEFLHLLRDVKPCLKKVYKDVFCVTPMVTALNYFIHNKSSSPFWGIFSLFCGIFSLFLENYSGSYEILYIYS